MWQSLRTYLFIPLLAASLSSAAARGQTTFEWPEQPIDVSHYATVEECLAVTLRVRDSVALRGPVWRDTLQYTAHEAAMPLPEHVTDVARRCGARFAEPEVPITDFAPTVRLYLFAGRDSDATALVTRRLAAVEPKADHERAAVLDTAVKAYIRAQPSRLVAAGPLLKEFLRLGAASPAVARMELPFAYMNAAIGAGDTVRARWAAEEVTTIADSLTPAERRSSWFDQGGKIIVYNALKALNGKPLLDSLRRSTASYVTLKRGIWARATGQSPDGLDIPIGAAAPPIEGDFWFRRGDANGTRPTRGKVSLVVLVDHSCVQSRHHSNVDRCWVGHAALRRLAQRFPTLEITIVTETRGWFSEMVPPTPRQEADTIRHWLLDFHHLPGALSVTKTDFWRLPGLDRRRIDREVPNVAHYVFHGEGNPFVKSGSYASFLVDRSGTIMAVAYLSTDRHDELRLGTLIDILLNRQTAASR